MMTHSLRSTAPAILLFLSTSASFSPRRSPAEAQEVRPLPVREAIDRGVKWLLKVDRSSLEKTEFDPDDLMLWTLLSAGLPRKDSRCQALYTSIVRQRFEKVHQIALRAMILEHMERATGQEQIWECAQFLVDNQCKNGDWSEGIPYGDERRIGAPPKALDAPIPPIRYDASGKQVVFLQAPVSKRHEGGSAGDLFNSEFAALGLRACQNSGILIPKEVVEPAIQVLHRGQRIPNARKEGSSSAGGWASEEQAPVTGGATASGICALAILNILQGNDYRKDGSIDSAFKWLEEHYSVSANPGETSPDRRYYRYMAALECACGLCGRARLGDHDWYAEGCKELLRRQREDGSWSDSKETNGIGSTCFAIQFLSRSTIEASIR